MKRTLLEKIDEFKDFPEQPCNCPFVEDNTIVNECIHKVCGGIIKEKQA